MSSIRPELSSKNKYWIDRHRFYELKHFCLQYKEWKKTYSLLNDIGINTSMINDIPKSNDVVDLTASCAIKKAECRNRIKMVESAALETDSDLWFYIVKAVTEGLSYTQMKMKYDIPCSRDTYYDRYRRFFWLLNQYRN